MSSWASSPNDGGHVAAGFGAIVRYVVPPVSFMSVGPPLESCDGTVGNPAGTGPGGATGTVMNRERAFTCVTTKAGSAGLSDSPVRISSTGAGETPGAPPGGLWDTARSNFAGSPAF